MNVNYFNLIIVAMTIHYNSKYFYLKTKVLSYSSLQKIFAEQCVSEI
ncbi:hypothetical protein XNW1_780010 [Xenorhabdus nematophila str. Websteri]|nr:hypothetical protein XNW1_4490010 [Xenorhabdus nematophila str. Websteri]CEF34082.1 hypothetical protein XNW1_780010 [Xenorhabdus nematophila str. Websteri]